MENKINKIINNTANAEIMNFIYKFLPENQKFDYKRLYYTLMITKTILDENYGSINKIKVLELGGKSVFTELLIKYINNIEVYHLTGGDYRKSINTNIKYDFIINTEIIEHLGDLDSNEIGVISTFTHSGLDNFLRNIKKNFHDETRMLVTTPNVNSYFPIFNLINCRNPYGYNLHFHEYGIYELKDILEQHFYLEYYNGIDLMEKLWNGFDQSFINDIDLLCKKYYKTENKMVTNERGTNILSIVQLKRNNPLSLNE